VGICRICGDIPTLPTLQYCSGRVLHIFGVQKSSQGHVDMVAKNY